MQARANIVPQEVILSDHITFLFQELPFGLDQTNEFVLKRFSFFDQDHDLIKNSSCLRQRSFGIISVHNVQALEELLKPPDTVPEDVFILDNLIEYARDPFPFLPRKVVFSEYR
jgi:hypothetical protein